MGVINPQTFTHAGWRVMPIAFPVIIAPGAAKLEEEQRLSSNNHGRIAIDVGVALSGINITWRRIGSGVGVTRRVVGCRLHNAGRQREQRDKNKTAGHIVSLG